MECLKYQIYCDFTTYSLSRWWSGCLLFRSEGLRRGLPASSLQTCWPCHMFDQSSNSWIWTWKKSEGKEAGEQLTLPKGMCSMTDYMLQFWTIVVGSAWNDPHWTHILRWAALLQFSSNPPCVEGATSETQLDTKPMQLGHSWERSSSESIAASTAPHLAVSTKTSTAMN